MCIKLFLVLLLLMIVNQLMGTGYGAWKEGFQREKFLAGCYKLLVLCLGYGTVAVSAYAAGAYIEAAQYISGLLIEPVCRYFAKLVGTLRSMVEEKTVGQQEKKKIHPGH